MPTLSLLLDYGGMYASVAMTLKET
jgi:hypothetical protein